MIKPTVLLAAASLCSGCAFQSQVNRAAVDYNQAVANSTNQLTLLNILRAAHRQPLHFTSISQVQGSFKATSGLGLAADLVGSSRTSEEAGSSLTTTLATGADTLTPTVSAEVSGGPSFDIAVLDTQEFYQGILAAVDPAIVAHFLQQGWPADLLTALLVERVEFHVRAPKIGVVSGLPSELGPRPYQKEEVIWSLSNDPDDRAGVEFGRFIQCFALRASEASADPTPLVRLDQIKELKLGDLTTLDGEKLSLSGNVGDPDRVVQRPNASAKLALHEIATKGHEKECAFIFRSDDPHKTSAQLSVDLIHLPKVATSGKSPGKNGSPLGAREAALHQAVELLKQESAEEGGFIVHLTAPGQQENPDRLPRDEVLATAHIVLRSPQAVIYFLGEYVRADLGLSSPSPYTLAGEPVFIMRRNGSANAFTSASFAGGRYSIPADAEDSMRALSLVQQLFNLQKSSKDKPSTASVRVID